MTAVDYLDLFYLKKLDEVSDYQSVILNIIDVNVRLISKWKHSFFLIVGVNNWMISLT